MVVTRAFAPGYLIDRGSDPTFLIGVLTLAASALYVLIVRRIGAAGIHVVALGTLVAGNLLAASLSDPFMVALGATWCP
jgi:hypothetical protein